MNKLFNWIKTLGNTKPAYIKPQKFVDLKRNTSEVSFIYPDHPLYNTFTDEEENKLRILAPNESAYNETSLTHNFVAIVIYNDLKYLVVNSFKHFKEQSIGGLLQYDETIYNVIPFFEEDDEYQTGSSSTFIEAYEYDHPVESYAFLTSENNNEIKITIERGKKPITAKMIDSLREIFTAKLPQEQIELIDYVIIPAINAYNKIQEQRKNKAS